MRIPSIDINLPIPYTTCMTYIFQGNQSGQRCTIAVFAESAVTAELLVQYEGYKEIKRLDVIPFSFLNEAIEDDSKGLRVLWSEFI